VTQYKYKIGSPVGEDGTIGIRLGGKTNPTHEQFGITPGETIIETDDKRVTYILDNDIRFEEVI